MNITFVLVISLLLVYSTYTDIKGRYVMMVPIYACFLIAIIEYFLPQRNASINIWGLIPGVVLLMIGKVSKGAIGSGDAYIVMVIGIFMGLKVTFEILMIGSVIAALYCIYMIAAKGKDCKDSIPFVPFIFSGFLGVLMFG